MNLREVGYDGTKADDVYIVRVYYTADDLGNIQVASGLETFGEDNTDTYGRSLSGDEWGKYYTLENRKCSYVDFWILPEGVSTVLNFADETPKPAPSNETYTLDLGDSLTVSNDTFNAILAENATATSPKTGDAAPIVVYVVLAVAAVGVIVFVKKRKMA